MKKGRLYDKQEIELIAKSAIGKSLNDILNEEVVTIEDKETNSLRIVSKRLSELLNKEVIFINDTKGSVLEDAINKMKPKDVLLMENTRFEDLDNEKESKNDKELGKYWASLGDIYINDAFGTSHRSHASNVGIASNLPNGIGFLIEKELNNMKEVIDNPKRPFNVILGGAKVSDKIGVIKNLVLKICVFFNIPFSAIFSKNTATIIEQKMNGKIR